MKLIAVNVGRPAPIHDEKTGRTVLSGIAKRAVRGPSVWVGATNIDGDGQADLQAHGGVDKAVYSYTLDHIPTWMREIGYGEGIDAPFGENLSVRGLLEEDIHIGDRWLWGDAVLEIAQPRWPCFKLGLYSGHRDLPARLIESERSGWYARVVTEGEAPPTGHLTLGWRDPDAPTVRETFQAARGLVAPERAQEIVAHPALASRWRAMLLKRYPDTVPAP